MDCSWIASRLSSSFCPTLPHAVRIPWRWLIRSPPLRLAEVADVVGILLSRAGTSHPTAAPMGRAVDMHVFPRQAQCLELDAAYLQAMSCFSPSCAKSQQQGGATLRNGFFHSFQSFATCTEPSAAPSGPDHGLTSAASLPGCIPPRRGGRAEGARGRLRLGLDDDLCIIGLPIAGLYMWRSITLRRLQKPMGIHAARLLLAVAIPGHAPP